MSFNVIETAKGLFTNELISKASSYLGESEHGIARAMSGIIPSILGGITEKATTSHEGASTILNVANNANDSGFMNNIGGFLSNDGGDLMKKGASLLGGLFGDSKSNVLGSLISQFSGVKSGSATSLLSMAAPILLGLLGKHAKSSNLDAGGLSSLLNGQKSNIMHAIPAGLNLDSVFSGLGVSSTVRSHGSTKHETNENKESGLTMRILIPALLLGLLTAAILYLTRGGCGGADTGHKKNEAIHDADHATSTTTSTTTTTTLTAAGKLDTLTGDFIYDLGDNVEIDLPNNGGKLTVGKYSTEYKLVGFLNDNNAMIDSVKGNWFEFTNVRFKTGGSEITEESLTQLTNLVTIAKAYPNAKFKIGGYTDNTGKAASNLSLSQRRADAVATKIKSLGMDPAAITGAEGFGQEWPIATNDTPEGRAQNRRVAVNVKAK